MPSQHPKIDLEKSKRDVATRTSNLATNNFRNYNRDRQHKHTTSRRQTPSRRKQEITGTEGTNQIAANPHIGGKPSDMGTEIRKGHPRKIPLEPQNRGKMVKKDKRKTHQR